jgi:hypothetical protein
MAPICPIVLDWGRISTTSRNHLSKISGEGQQQVERFEGVEYRRFSMPVDKWFLQHPVSHGCSDPAKHAAATDKLRIAVPPE